MGAIAGDIGVTAGSQGVESRVTWESQHDHKGGNGATGGYLIPCHPQLPSHPLSRPVILHPSVTLLSVGVLMGVDGF